MLQPGFLILIVFSLCIPVFCFTGAKILGHDMTFVQIKQLFVGLLQNFNWENCVAFCSKVGPRLISAYAIGIFDLWIIAWRYRILCHV